MADQAPPADDGTVTFACSSCRQDITAFCHVGVIEAAQIRASIKLLPARCPLCGHGLLKRDPGARVVRPLFG